MREQKLVFRQMKACLITSTTGTICTTSTISLLQFVEIIDVQTGWTTGVLGSRSKDVGSMTIPPANTDETRATQSKEARCTTTTGQSSMAKKAKTGASKITCTGLLGAPTTRITDYKASSTHWSN